MGLPIIGNMLDLRGYESGFKALEHLADTYGDVYRITVGGRRIVVFSSAELLLKYADETQLVKVPPPALSGGNKPRGLFLAEGDDPDWGQAHRILSPAMGPLSVEAMFDGTSF